MKKFSIFCIVLLAQQIFPAPDSRPGAEERKDDESGEVSRDAVADHPLRMLPDEHPLAEKAPRTGWRRFFTPSTLTDRQKERLNEIIAAKRVETREGHEVLVTKPVRIIQSMVKRGGALRAYVDRLDETYRSFVVKPNADGTLFERTAAVIAATSALSSERFKEMRKEGEAIRNEMRQLHSSWRASDEATFRDKTRRGDVPSTDEYRELEASYAAKTAELYVELQAALAEHGTVSSLQGVKDVDNAFVFSFSPAAFPEAEKVVLKIPNPYPSFAHQVAHRVNGLQAANHSPRRNVE